MNNITLMKDGSMSHNGKIVESNPLFYLGFKVELVQDYTLRSYFRMLEKYSPFSQMNQFFSDSMEQYQACPESRCTSQLFDHLEFNKTVEMIGYPGKPRLEIYHSLQGRKGEEIFDIKSAQLENTLDLPLMLGKLKHIVLGDKVDTFEFDTVFNLFEFIDGVAWELSFQGSPTQCEIRR